MKISGYGSITSSTGPKKSAGTSQAGSFADILSAAEAGEPSAAGHTSDVAATAALTNLLALQEISDEDIHRRKLIQQGNNLLDVLEKLRHHLLLGTLPPHLLRDLGRHIDMQKQFVSDPRLGEIIADIELRAAVELAKLEMAVARQESGATNR